MRKRHGVGVVCALLTVVAALTGCQSSGSSDSRLGQEPSPARTVTSSGFGAEFLGVDECSSFGTTNFTEVSCGSERASARVIARYDGKVADGPLCPATTDFVLHISEQSGASGEDGGGAIPQGYACMRNLQPPHPGDPGGGGGPRTIVGDCVYSAGKGEVRETACDGKAENKPEFKVASAVKSRAQCPGSTSLYVELGGPKPVGCARKL
ncbi:hypothetical protein [Streptomyces cavernae]|uniref:hypothetical protein n=1 Tax=Streptomyces cavernae TaxID=2259034 RepID=UPI000FEBF802|nr:hypothetical protein [Streptomyces cavernae]